MIIIVLVILNTLLLYNLNSNNNYINELQLGISTVNGNLVMVRGKKDKLVSNLELSFIDRGKRVSNFDSLLLVTNKPLLVFRIHQNNCNDCVSQSLIHIHELSTQNDNLPFNLVVSTNYRSVDLLRQDFNLKLLPVRYDDMIDLELDYTAQPYFLLVDQEGRVSNMFVPEYDMMGLFKAYLKSVSTY